MKTGKLPENVLKRSILRTLTGIREEIVQGAGIGEDCALFSFGTETGALSVTSFTAAHDGLITARTAAAVNNVAAAGADPLALLISAILPENIREEEIRKLADQIDQACRVLGVKAVGGDTRLTDGVNAPQITLTILGRRAKGFGGIYQPGQELVMSKWLGMLGTADLTRQNREVLAKRLPETILEEAERFREHISVIEEAKVGVEVGVVGMHDLSRGGVFDALWELAERAKTGFEVDLKEIPIRQETVEITEVLGVNPYELHGAGSLLFVCYNGNELVQKLKKQHISAKVIGRLTKERGKVLLQEKEKRYLDRPAGDRLMKMEVADGHPDKMRRK